MIKSEEEYNCAKKSLDKFEEATRIQAKYLRESKSLSEDDIKRALEPSISYIMGTKEEIQFYEKLKTGIIDFIPNGIVATCARVFKEKSAEEMADLLGIKLLDYIRLEDNQFNNKEDIAQNILDSLGLRLELVDTNRKVYGIYKHTTIQRYIEYNDRTEYMMVKTDKIIDREIMFLESRFKTITALDLLLKIVNKNNRVGKYEFVHIIKYLGSTSDIDLTTLQSFSISNSLHNMQLSLEHDCRILDAMHNGLLEDLNVYS